MGGCVGSQIPSRNKPHSQKLIDENRTQKEIINPYANMQPPVKQNSQNKNTNDIEIKRNNSNLHHKMSLEMQNVITNNHIFDGIQIYHRGIMTNDWVNLDGIYKYRGQWEAGLRQGLGMLYDQSHQILIVAAFQANRLIQTKCRKITSGGKIYFGRLNNKLQVEGQGILQQKNYRYEGNFKNDRPNGVGTEEHKDSKFKGEFVNGQKKLGTLQTSKGTYQGSFVNNLKEGKGKFIWKDGGMYQGSFKNGEMDGQGILYDKQQKYLGKHIFESGKIVL